MITWRLFSILSILSCFRSYYSVLPLKVNKVVQNVPEKKQKMLFRTRVHKFVGVYSAEQSKNY